MKNLTERLVIGGVALLVGLLLGWMVRGVATYNNNAAVLASYEDWRVTCPAASVEKTTCELSTDIMDKASPIRWRASRSRPAPTANSLSASTCRSAWRWKQAWA